MHRSLSSFFNNPALSDIDVINPASGTTYKCHKVVLAAASDLFDTIFTENDPAQVKAFSIPKHIATKSNLIDDPFPKVMEYIYSNQDFSQIKPDIDEINVSNIYSQAFSLNIHKLKSDLEKCIVEQFLNPETCCGFYLEAIRFGSEFLAKKSRAMIIDRFEEIANTKNGSEFLNELPFDAFFAMIEDPELNVSEEIQVVKIIDRYLNHRRALPLLQEEDPAHDWSHLTPEEKKNREEQKAKSTDEEKKREEENHKKDAEDYNKLDPVGKIQFTCNKKQEEIIKEIEKSLEVKRLTKEQKDRCFKAIRYSYLKHEELIETSFNPNFDVAKDYIMQGLSYRLDPYEKSSFKEYTIDLKPRKNYDQEMENKLIENFAQNRNQQYTQKIKQEQTLSQMANNKAQMQIRAQQQQQTPNPQQFSNPQQFANPQQQQQYGSPQQQQQQQQQQQFPQQRSGNPQQQQRVNSNQGGAIGGAYQPNGLSNQQQQQQKANAFPPQQQQDQRGFDLMNQNLPQQYQQDPQRYEAFQNQIRLQPYKQDLEIGGPMAQSKFQLQQTAPSVLDPHFQKQQQMISGMQNPTMPINKDKFLRSQSPYSQTLNPQYGQMAGGIAPQIVQQQQQMMMSGPTPMGMGGLNQAYPKAPQKEMYNVHAQTSFSPKKQSLQPYQANKYQNPLYGTHLSDQLTPGENQTLEFIYEFDFDENGIFYYLGTYAKKRSWQNPHALGLVHCFASSIGSGKVEDIIGRQVVNCRTLNEPFSFFGIDIGETRFLIPTCYSLRNRNSQTHVLMNWHFEASNDKINWAILDRRIYLSDNINYNQEMEVEQKQLCKKGATSTWGIDQSIYNEVGTQGFRYFRIVQVGKNSSGSDNLTLSGLELYGRVVHNAPWEF